MFMSHSKCIRKARQADAEILPFVEQSAGKAFLVLPDLAWIADDTVTSADCHREWIAGGTVWVAVDEGDNAVGFLSAEWFGLRLHIWGLAVRHDLQGRGLGRGLVECAIREARSRGAEELSLTTFRNVPWNRPFYEKLGFRTLDADSVPRDLQDVLDHEVECGIPGEARCAMVRAPR